MLLDQIMGLNPPFGLRASLANKFIDKALEFRPKLLILIVPVETQRYWFVLSLSLSLSHTHTHT
jgi:predicted RNA methylase